MTQAKILVVDDSEDMRKLICLYLRQDGYVFVDVASGPEAIKIAAEEMPDLILLDVTMPGMDGYETCQRLKQNPATADIPVLFLTARVDTKDKVTGLDAGAADYILKQTPRGEILARIRNHLKIGQLTRQLKENQRLIEADMKAAAEIQQTLIPASVPDMEGLRMSWRFQPCRFVGGDIFNIIRLDEAHTAFYMIDVSGHGVPSAMITVSVSQMLMQNMDQLVKKEPVKGGYYEIVSPDEVLNKLNRQYPIERFGRFFTMVYMMINTRNKYLHYSSAGHPPPILVTGGGEMKLLEKGGPLIGVCSAAAFESERVEFESGCRVFLYTDGIMDCENESGEFFGADRFYDTVERFKHEPVEKALDHICETVQAFAGSTPLRDDVSIIGIEGV